MFEDTEEKKEAIIELIKSLEAIRSSKEVYELIDDMKHEAENSGSVLRVKTRIKENESAVRKYKKYEKQYGEHIPKIRDLCGMMIITDSIEDVYKCVDFFKDRFTDKTMRDYIRSPNAGYRSIHLYSDFFTDNISIPMEIQIKTEAMSIAQDTTHDSIYKVESRDQKLRDELSTALFPIFEKFADADRFEERGNIERAKDLRTEAVAIRDANFSLFSINRDVVNNSWKSYGKALFKHHNLAAIEGGLILKNFAFETEDKEKLNQQLEDALEKLFAYYCENVREDVEIRELSTDRKIDYAIARLGTMNQQEFIEELKLVLKLEIDRAKEKETLSGIGEFTQRESNGSCGSRISITNDISR